MNRINKFNEGKISFRLFQPEDAEVVSGYMKSLYNEDPDGKPLNDQKIEKTFKNLSVKPDLGFITIIEWDKKIVGYALIINYWSNEYGGIILLIDELYIQKEYRRLGLATTYLNFLFNNRINNCVAFRLEVMPSNNLAYNLYQKLGFVKHKNRHLIYELP